jgi:hypothetical protein
MAKKIYTIKAPSRGDFQENGNTADAVREPIPIQGSGTKDDRPFPTEKKKTGYKKCEVT